MTKQREDCGICMQPYHRYSTSDPEHKWNGVACVNTLLTVVEQRDARIAALEAMLVKHQFVRGRCPECQRDGEVEEWNGEGTGHGADCALAALLPKEMG